MPHWTASLWPVPMSLRMYGEGISAEAKIAPLVQGLSVKQELSLSSSSEVGKNQTKQKHENSRLLAYTCGPRVLRQNHHGWVPGAPWAAQLVIW